MKSIIVKLISVKDGEKSMITDNIGFDFRLTRLAIGDIAIFEKINSERFLSTSKVKDIKINEENIEISTQNLKYCFKVV